MMEKKYLKKSKGQGVLEVVIAISVIVVGLLSVLSLIFFNINTQDYNHKMLIASNLAREGIEIIRNIRDSNWLDEEKEWNDSLWIEGSTIEEDYNSFVTLNWTNWGEYEFDYGLVPLGISWEDCIDKNYSMGYAVCELYSLPLNGDTNYTFFDNWGSLLDDTEETPFYRLIYINEICGVDGVEDILEDYKGKCSDDKQIGIQVISRVGWKERNRIRFIEIEDRLYDWK